MLLISLYTGFTIENEIDEISASLFIKKLRVQVSTFGNGKVVSYEHYNFNPLRRMGPALTM